MIIYLTCGIGAILLVIARVWAAPRRGRDLASWPRVMACVVGADIRPSIVPGLHQTAISVAYTVDGQRRILKRIHPADTFGRALTRTLKHRVGSQTWVSYNPERPEEAILAAAGRRSLHSPALGGAVAG
jgi:hypothetical protein